MQVPLLLLGALLVAQTGDARPVVQSRPDAVVLNNCLITLSEQAQVPANEPGALVRVPVKDGDSVVKDQVLAQIDDRRSVIERDAAKYKWQAAEEKSTNDISVRFAQAAAKVAKAQVQTGEEANRKVTGSVTESQMREWRLEYEKYILQAEQAHFDMHTQGIEAMEHKAEMDGAQENINRRQIKAPLDGVVVDLKRHEGEWMQAGDPLLRVVRVDRLRVEAFVPATDYSAADLSGRPVTVSVALPHGRQETFSGSVVFINPQVMTSGDFQVRVEVLNRKENNFWLLRPGVTADVTIHLR